MLDFPLMIDVQVKLPVVNTIQPQSNKFATGVESEATGVSKLNDSPDFLFKNPLIQLVGKCIMLYQRRKALTI